MRRGVEDPSSSVTRSESSARRYRCLRLFEMASITNLVPSGEIEKARETSGVRR